MLRRSACHSTPRRKYTVDAFEGIAQLQQRVDNGIDGHDNGDDVDRGPGDDVEDNLSDGDDFGSEAHATGDVDLISLDGGNEHTPTPRRRRNGSSAPKLAHTRGLVEPFVNGSASRPSRRRICCGPSPVDYEPLEKAVHKWGYASPLPKREVDSNGCGGFASSFYDPDCGGRRDGKLDIDQSQPPVSLLNPDKYRAYVEATQFLTARFLLGPSRARQLSHADPGEATPLLKDKPGFILNVGARIQCLEWVPKQTSHDQYLTVSLAPHEARAFQSQPRYRSIVQIWHLRATEDGHVAINQIPAVRMVLCSEWGDVVYLKWSPFGAGHGSLGLLAAVWTDGSLRVVTIPESQDSEGISYVRLSEPLAEYRCPDTLFTSICWPSRHEIVAGCANGFVAVFHLDRLGTSRPAVYRPVTDGYITNISSCAPSRPHLILVESLGRVTLSDLSHPQNSGQTASSQRMRTGALQVAWSDHCQSVVTTDDVRGIQALPLRKLSYMKAVGTNKAVTTTIAGSPCHPHILVGGVGGEVTCLNLLQRFLNGRGAIHQQKWFVHEWRRARGQEAEPMSRFIEGHKLDEIRFGPDENKSVRMDGEIGEAVIYEEGTAIVALSWNPNLQVAGWAAAALGSGMIRVEDIAV